MGPSSAGEDPRLYGPRWSDEIITETHRNLEDRIALSNDKPAYLVGQSRKHFGHSWPTENTDDVITGFSFPEDPLSLTTRPHPGLAQPDSRPL